MMKHTYCLMMVLIVFWWCVPAFGEMLELGVEDAWPPYSNPDGTGISNAIVKAAYQSVGIDVTLIVRPYKRLVIEAKEGQYIGIFNVARDSTTEQEFLWGQETLLITKTYYYHHVERPLKAQTADELQHGERIGVILGYEYGEKFAKNDQIVKEWVKEYQQNVQKLLANRLDALIMSERGGQKLLSDMHLTDIIVPAFPAEASYIYVAFSKTDSTATYYAEKLDEGLRIIKANGVYDTILNRE